MARDQSGPYTPKSGPFAGQTFTSRGAYYYQAHEKPRAEQLRAEGEQVSVRETRALFSRPRVTISDKTQTRETAFRATPNLLDRIGQRFADLSRPRVAIRALGPDGRWYQTRSWQNVRQARADLNKMLAQYGVKIRNVSQMELVSFSDESESLFAA